ncbi:hypothetical protein BC828DRAFT_417064 [Blastocladiella britannica]|nr:hypothetical protein BC828DRAFT_417064 [Blastocladiella britannica]
MRTTRAMNTTTRAETKKALLLAVLALLACSTAHAQVVTPIGPAPDAAVVLSATNRSYYARAAAFGPRPPSWLLPVLPPPTVDLPPSTTSPMDRHRRHSHRSPYLAPSTASPPVTVKNMDDDEDDDDKEEEEPVQPQTIGILLPLAVADPHNRHGCLPVPADVVRRWPPSAAPLPVSPGPSRGPGLVDGDVDNDTLLPLWQQASTNMDDDDAWRATSTKHKQPLAMLPVDAPWIAVVERGGCGFIDKVRAMQRSGAVGVVVGDADGAASGDPLASMLVTMYAGGDTSDVQIPSVFVVAADLAALVTEAQLRPRQVARIVGDPSAGVGDWSAIDVLLAAIVAPLVLMISVYVLCRACVRSATGGGRFDGANGSGAGGVPEPATSARAMARLERRVFFSAKVGEDGQLACVVCLDDFCDEEEVSVVPCGHYFHVSCIETWLRDRKNVCPICRYELVDPEADEDGDEEGGNGALNSDLRALAALVDMLGETDITTPAPPPPSSSAGSATAAGAAGSRTTTRSRPQPIGNSISAHVSPATGSAPQVVPLTSASAPAASYLAPALVTSGASDAMLPTMLPPALPPSAPLPLVSPQQQQQQQQQPPPQPVSGVMSEASLATATAGPANTSNSVPLQVIEYQTFEMGEDDEDDDVSESGDELTPTAAPRVHLNGHDQDDEEDDDNAPLLLAHERRRRG